MTGEALARCSAYPRACRLRVTLPRVRIPPSPPTIVVLIDISSLFIFQPPDRPPQTAHDGEQEGECRVAGPWLSIWVTMSENCVGLKRGYRESTLAPDGS